ncbi:hypothetical protein [Cupriavidus sp. EM10]|uniref:hypothetical protein n=1 Tax=Cupriavidus sp. EM10 TaxID=2839983 RepID=UPI001C00742B|nr:hypothetical protein [Cupriavidus sp. EM10]QWE98150.1 hypothetical protein KLP38_28520 [Cupriavidus sp. EM10]
MTIKNPQGRPDVEEVLLQFAAEQALPTASQLNQYIEAYPEFKSELIDFAASLINDKFYVEAPDTEEAETIAKRAVSRFHNLRFASEKDRNAETSFKRQVVNPFAPLSREQFGALVDLIGVPKKVVAKLRDRRIKFATIPQGLIALLAQQLEVSLDVMIEHLQAKPQMARLASSSLSSRESNHLESFDEALRLEGASSTEIAALRGRFSDNV